MTVLSQYLAKDRTLSAFEQDTKEHDFILEELDDLWWRLSEEETKVAELVYEGKWVKIGNCIYCPICGYRVKSNGGEPVRCYSCMHAVTSGVIECE